MPNWQSRFRAIAAATGYAVVAVAILAAALHFRHGGSVSAPVAAPPFQGDPLAPELARCQAIGMAARNDAGCAAVWAENRRRFFTYRPADGEADPKPPQSGGR